MERYALITGASRGLGACIAAKFRMEGYHLCLVARDKTALNITAESLPGESKTEVLCLPADMAETSASSALFAEVTSCFPHLDVLINNAATHGPIGPLWENDDSDWLRTIQVNLLSPVSLCRAFIPFMKEKGGGSIINISGGGATGPRPNFSAYGTAKAGLVRFSETLAQEVKPYGIRVNCVAPGAMKTQLLGEILNKGAGVVGETEFESAIKASKEGTASLERVADLALFLASKMSAEITGKLVSAVWDDWKKWPEHLSDLNSSDVYTLRRITGRDRGHTWGDK